MNEKRVNETCEECSQPAAHLWGMDLTPLCPEHYEEANEIEDWRALNAVFRGGEAREREG